VAFDLFKANGAPLEHQKFTWRELVQPPFSKLDDDAFTRIRVNVMSGIEAEAVRFSHACARMNHDLQPELAAVRRIEHHQQAMVGFLAPPDLSPLETTIGLGQTAVEVAAAVAQHEPDGYLAQVYRFGLLEELDHLYRFAALYDRIEGKDANTLLQSYTDIVPGRPTVAQHRAPVDDLRRSYDRVKARPLTKLHAITVLSIEQQHVDRYAVLGPMFSDPLARQLYAEIGSVEEQHVTQYSSIADAGESWLERWVLHEANEVYCYWSCVEYEKNPRVRGIWERFLDYELGHLALARGIFEEIERRDVEEILPGRLPDPIRFESQRPFIREVADHELALRAAGTELIPGERLPQENPSIEYAQYMNSEGSPSQMVAAAWRWMPTTELSSRRLRGRRAEETEDRMRRRRASARAGQPGSMR
jgi:hypothetical protein